MAAFHSLRSKATPE